MRVQIVSFHCVLKNKLGHLISSSFNQDVSTSPLEGDIDNLPGLTRALKKLKVGKKKKILLPAEDAYGFYDLELVSNVARTQLHRGAHLKPGDLVKAVLSPKLGEKVYRVTHAQKSAVTLDANHPLAGQDLIFEVELTASREEIDEERQFTQEETSLLC